MRLRHGYLEAAELEESRAEPGAVWESWRLVSSSGLVCEMSLRRPAGEGAPVPLVPLVLLLGGHRTGRDAVHLVPTDERLAVAAVSYPYDGPQKPKGLAVARALPGMRQALLDTPPCLSLTLDFLLDGGFVDPHRVELVGVSLGAPLVCVAGALDPRFTRVWSVHGGGDLAGLIAHNLPEELRPVGLDRVLGAFGGLIVAPLAPERFARRISPRPFVMINAEQDERIPRASVEALFASAREPKELLWIPGGHVAPSHEEVIGQLWDTVLPRILASDSRPVAPP